MSKLVDKEDIIMSEFNFKSAICTSRSQSERLLSLGLKKETADMYYEGRLEGEWPRIMPHKTEMDYFNLWDSIIPAWSLHRLLELNLLCCEQHFAFQFHITNIDDAYEYLINHTEWLIKEGYFNTDYLEEKYD